MKYPRMGLMDRFPWSKGEIVLATSKEWGRQLLAGKGTSGLAKTSSFFTPITAHSMFDYSIILELD